MVVKVGQIMSFNYSPAYLYKIREIKNNKTITVLEDYANPAGRKNIHKEPTGWSTDTYDITIHSTPLKRNISWL